MLGNCAGRKHLIAMEDEIAWLVECDRMSPGQVDALRSADSCNGGFDGRRIDGGRLITLQAKQNSAIGGVAFAGEGKRSVEIYLHAGDTIEHSRRELAGEAAGGAHGAHGV
jgi:hypothetical protein